MNFAKKINKINKIGYKMTFLHFKGAKFRVFFCFVSGNAKFSIGIHIYFGDSLIS